METNTGVRIKKLRTRGLGTATGHAPRDGHLAVGQKRRRGASAAKYPNFPSRRNPRMFVKVAERVVIEGALVAVARSV